MNLLEGSSPLGPLLPENWYEFIAGIVLFLIIWFVMAKRVVPSFEKTYAERADAIRGGMDRAEQAQKAAEAALADYTAQLAAARDEASVIREEAKAAGAEILAEMRDQANVEAARIIANANAQIESEKAQALASLRAEIGGLATALAGRIVGEALEDDARAKRTVDRFLIELDKDSAGSKA